MALKGGNRDDLRLGVGLGLGQLFQVLRLSYLYRKTYIYIYLDIAKTKTVLNVRDV